MKPTEQAIQDRVAANYEALRYGLDYAKRYHDWWMRQMIGLASAESRRGAVLDNGCGVGALAAHLGDARHLVGLDLSLTMLRTAGDAPFARAQGDSTALPFASETFDLVVARSLLHHLPVLEDGVREMHRVLRPGGQVILADTNHSLLSALPRRIAYRGASFSDDHKNPKRADYLGCLRRTFQLEAVRYFGYLAYPFGFPDMMGRWRPASLPRGLLDALIRLDALLGRVPAVRAQSWGIMVAARKAGGRSQDSAHGSDTRHERDR